MGPLGRGPARALGGGGGGEVGRGNAGERFGSMGTVGLTEVLTRAGFLAILVLPLGAILAVLPLVGLAMNGTSSVLYASVADFVAAHRLKGVYVGQSAIVDGRLVQIGTKIDSAELLKVEGNTAHFRCRDGIAVLLLDRRH